MLTKMTLPLFIIILQLIFVLASLQRIYRGLDGKDSFPNPNGKCLSGDCLKSNSICLPNMDCCRCRCALERTYWTATNSCKDAAGATAVINSPSWKPAGRKFAFNRVQKDVIIVMKAQRLRESVKISHCNQPEKECTGLATRCQIEKEKTFYDNGGWERLWPKFSDVDFSFMGVSSGDALVWDIRGCETNKYDGLLIKLGIECSVRTPGNQSRIESAIVFKIVGSYNVGTNPLLRSTCRASTTEAPTSKAATTTDNFHTTIATTISASTTSAATKMTPGSTINKKTTAKLYVTKSFAPVMGITHDEETKTDSSLNSNEMMILVTSASSGGLLLVIVVITVAVATWLNKKRYCRSNHHEECLADQRAPWTPASVFLNDASGPIALDVSLALPAIENNSFCHDVKYWTVDADGECIAAAEAPSFTVHSRENSCEMEDGLYDLPITRRSSSIDKLYSKVGVNWKKNLKENDDGYSSIDDMSTPANARKSLALNQKSSSKNNPSVAQSSPSIKQKKTTLKTRQVNRDQTFEMQNIGFRNSGFTEPNADDDGTDIEALEEDLNVSNDSYAGTNPAYEDIDTCNDYAGDSDEDSEPECMFYDPSEP